MIRDYIVGQTETLTLVPIGQADGSNQFIKVDGILVNGMSDLILYTDAGGASPVPGGDYSETTIDTQWTADEAQAGGTTKTVFSQYKVTNATYQGIELWATFTNFGTYTSNDAAFEQVGGSEEVNTSATLVVPEGHTRYRFNFDSTAGDISPTMPNGAFDGQQVILNEIGGGNVAYITGAIETALAGGNEIYIWNADDSEWLLSGGNNVVRAEYKNQISNIGVSPYNYSILVEDTHNAVTTGVSWKFTAPISGIYSISGTMVPASSTAAQDIEIFKNGTLYKPLEGIENTPAVVRRGYYGTIRLSADDYIHVQQDFALVANSDDTISIERIGKY